jgi:hypothetical protein
LYRLKDKFEQLLEKMKRINRAKRHDYAKKEDVLSNFRICELGGIPAWKGSAVRLSDKFSRLMEFMKQEKLKVKDEKIEDTLLDLANYALITLILYQESKNRPK